MASRRGKTKVKRANTASYYWPVKSLSIALGTLKGTTFPPLRSPKPATRVRPVQDLDSSTQDCKIGVVKRLSRSFFALKKSRREKGHSADSQQSASPAIDQF